MIPNLTFNRITSLKVKITPTYIEKYGSHYFSTNFISITYQKVKNRKLAAFFSRLKINRFRPSWLSVRIQPDSQKKK
jgi:hypothetical protein